MNVLFRLNYYTQPGQSLWVKVGVSLGEGGIWEEQTLPMEWLNPDQWQLQWEFDGESHTRIRYAYQFRQESNGLELDEWGEPRQLAMAADAVHTLFLRDDWRSAGTVDYAFETMAFRPVLPDRGPFEPLGEPRGVNHVLCLNMAAVPKGFVPCVIGDIDALGNWDRSRAVPMAEVAANEWRVDLTFPPHGDIEYKYGLFDLEHGDAPELETGENRRLEAHAVGDAQLSVIHDEVYRRHPASLYRAAGVAVPVFSLRSAESLGVGEFADLKSLADWVHTVGLKMIQILPVNDTTSSHSWTDSYPYSAISVFALHPIYLRLEDLDYRMPKDWSAQLDAARDELNILEQLDHQRTMAVKIDLTRQMFDKHRKAIITSPRVVDFLDEHEDWLIPYAAFCVKRDQYGTANFLKWGEDAFFDQSKTDAMMVATHAESDAMFYHIWLQSELDAQLKDAADHLRGHGVALKGDLPIGVDRESADAWSAPQLFHMDAQAGAPPDAFSEKGQNWGFPTYNWDVMREDGFEWWCERFDHLSRYFDAFRIDHILGFFRIWQVPIDQVEGIMGWFEPALPVRIEEFEERGIDFDYERFCTPYIPESILEERFGDAVDEVLETYLKPSKSGVYQLREAFSTQRKVVDHFQHKRVPDDARERMQRIRQGLLDCISDVLFFMDPGSGGTCFHPRFFIQRTQSFAALDEKTQERVDALYVDYFFLRQDGFWQARGMEKLPALRRASDMLLCGEDLGMVPDCVPGVMRELGILSLEIQRMPKTSEAEFSDPAHAPYLSVASPSTHDMSTLRDWWSEDRQVTGRFAWYQLNEAHPPEELSGELVEKILRQHLESPAMWVVFPLQDLLAMDEDLRQPDPSTERINIPAIMPYNWRYRMHLTLKQLTSAKELNERISALLDESGR